jgi:hypothetical protein
MTDKNLIKTSPQEIYTDKHSLLINFFVRQLPKILISLALFSGGIGLLLLKIPGWSLFLGLPATQIGIIFLIFSFDDLAKKHLGPESLHLIYCSICSKPTLAPLWQKEKICRECQEKIGKKTKKERA